MRRSTTLCASLFALSVGLAPARAADAPQPPVVWGGYVEGYYQWNLNKPSNGVTNLRGFDNRHNSFTLSNVAVDARWDHEDLVGRLTLQAGHTAATYYSAEPTSPGASGANTSDAGLWRNVQQAYAGWRMGADRQITVSAGVFLSPIGPEGMAVKDNWNWSRSNLFFGLPYYHTGARVAYAPTSELTITAAVYNGWNSVVDGNEQKSPSLQVTYTRGSVTTSLLYFGGVERPQGSPEGARWRHLVDAHLTWDVTSRLSLLAHADAGTESTRFGTARWVAGAAYVRVKVASPLYVALRGDTADERVPDGASPMVWPVPRVTSGTATIDYRPHERASVRLEGRHDRASRELFFGGKVEGDGGAIPFVPNRKSQSTVTLGLTTWF